MTKFIRLNNGTVIRTDRIAWMERSKKHEFDFDIWEETDERRTKLGVAYESEIKHLWDSDVLVPDTSGSVVHLFGEFSDEGKTKYEEFRLPVVAWRVGPLREQFAETQPVVPMCINDEAYCWAVLEMRRDGKATGWVRLSKGQVEYGPRTFHSFAQARQNYHEWLEAKHGKDEVLLSEEQKAAAVEHEAK
jgi:hypothetical protein